MRVLFDGHLAGPSMDGVGRYIVELVRAFRLYHPGIELIVIACEHQRKKGGVWDAPEFKGCSFEWVPYHKPAPLRQQLLVRGFVKKYSPDLYHHPQYDLPLFIGCPSVITIHDLKYLRYPHFFKGRSKLKARLQKWLMDYSISHAHRIIAVSGSTKKDISEFFTVSNVKIDIIHHGITIQNRQECRDLYDYRLNESRNVPEGRFFFYIGSKRPHKNIVNIIKAYNALLHKGYAGLKLIIAGNPYADYREPEMLVQDLNLEADVFFWENVRDSELQFLYDNATALIFPSLYEGFGLPVLEAMASGTPVITANASSLPEVAGDAADLVNPYNHNEIVEAMLRLLNDTSYRNACIAKGYKQVANFTWSECADKTIRSYKQALEE